MRRELRAVATGAILGAVDDSADLAFEGVAGEVLSRLRRQLGDAKTIEMVLQDGWSNGQIYFAEATP